jgi:hypothetical protein
MIRIIKVIKEIFLYREYLSILKKEEKNSPTWSKLKLRRDWFGRVYTVINLPPEVTESRDFPKESRPAFAFEMAKPINNYLTELNLQELIVPGMNPIKGTEDGSYLVIYGFLFRHFSLLWLLRFLAEISIIVTLYLNWTYISSYINF